MIQKPTQTCLMRHSGGRRQQLGISALAHGVREAAAWAKDDTVTKPCWHCPRTPRCSCGHLCPKRVNCSCREEPGVGQSSGQSVSSPVDWKNFGLFSLAKKNEAGEGICFPAYKYILESKRGGKSVGTRKGSGGKANE